MFFGFDLNQIFSFPFQDSDSRKHLLIGGLMAVAAMIIPLLPHWIILGYAGMIARQVLRGETPHMMAWEDWSGYLKRGARLFFIRLILSLPILLMVLPIFIGGIALPWITSGMRGSEQEAMAFIFSLGTIGIICITIPLSLPLALGISVAEIHVLEKDEFSAGFHFKEWWQVLRANLSGFVIAFVLHYFVSVAFVFVMQILAATFILACLLVILIPGMTIYLTLLMYVINATAYRQGMIRISEKESSPAVL